MDRTAERCPGHAESPRGQGIRSVREAPRNPLAPGAQRPGSPRLRMVRVMALIGFDENEGFLAGHPDWLFEDPAIQRTFELDDFAGYLDSVNRVGEVAEAVHHHQDDDSQ